MDEQERRRLLRTYGFSTAERLSAPATASAAESEASRPAGDGVEDAPTTAAASVTEASTRPLPAAHSGPSVFDRIVDSLGFRFGLAILTMAFAVGVAQTIELLPAGPLADAATTYLVLALTPMAATSWMAVGVLAPPAPFRTGLLLGLYAAALMAVLLVVEGSRSGALDTATLVVYSVATVIVALLTVGITGRVARRVFMPPAARLPFREQVELEPRSRPWPPWVIALAFASLPLAVFTNEATEWAFDAAFASAITIATIRGGLDVQRRYPERRTPVVVVGLFAGIVAGLAMLQAMWSESRWPERRASSDRIAIGVSVLLVIAAAHAAEFGVRDVWPDGQAYVVRPASRGAVSESDVELTRDILQARLTALDVEGRLTASDDGRITVRVPNDADEGLVYRVLSTTGVLEFTPVPSACAAQVVQDAPQPQCLDDAEPLFNGTEIAAARIGQDQTTGEIVVNLELKETGSRLFDEYADQVYQYPNPNDRLFAIVLDGTVASAPSINAPRFGGNAQVSGNFTLDEASALVAALQAGRSLPYDVSVSTEA